MQRPEKNIRQIVFNHIGDDDEVFGLWAFGPDFRHCDQTEYPLYWNAHHGDKLKLYPEGLITQDIPLMIEIWKKEMTPTTHSETPLT